MKKPFIVAALLGFTTLAAICCFSTPQEQIATAEELVARTSRIALATVVEAKYDRQTGDVTYTFEADKVLKGEGIDSFSIKGGFLRNSEDLKTFNDHKAANFWDSSDGRCYHDTDCKIHPGFAVGMTYLVFLDEPYHNKSFEQINMLGSDPSERDKWLVWVDQTVKAQKRKTNDSK